MDTYQLWQDYLKKEDIKLYNELSNKSNLELKEAFSLKLEFGTGGLRGIMGLGPGRINQYTISKVSKGLADTILQSNEYKSCAIAFDTRNNSEKFAKIAAGVLCASGIKVYMFTKATPTPMLSHAIRTLNAGWGVVVTASHNPKKYNGYKVYDNRGVQVLPNIANIISDNIDGVEMFSAKEMPLDEAKESGLLIELGDAQLEQYLNDDISYLPNIEFDKDFKIVYTALYGSGAIPVSNILHKMGFKNITCVQTNPDGNFGGLYMPNPEVKEVYKIAIEKAKKIGAKLILATDPDSDRVGVQVLHNGEFVALNGNQIGALLTDFILSQSKNFKNNDYIVTTIVSGDLGEKIAKSYNIDTLRVLTGFKYIGDIVETRQNGKFLLGFEESYGYLIGDAARDKDAVIASALIAGLAAKLSMNGIDLQDKYNDICKKFGYHVEDLESVEITGIDFKSKIAAIMENFRCLGEVKINDLTLNKIIDYMGETELPKSNVLKVIFNQNCWFAVRPSGTEPKIKFYYSASAENEEKANCLIKIMKTFVNEVTH